MAEFDGNNELWQLGLDIGPFIQSLQQALEAYNVFSKEFRKTLSVRLDPTSLNALSVAFGTQMRQAVQLIDGAQKESVTKSKKMASEVQKAMKGAFTEGFKELPAATRKAREQAASELTKLTQTAQSEGKKTGKALADGVRGGTNQALRDIKTQADAIKESHASVIAFTKGEQAKAEKAADRLQGIVTKQGQHLPTHLREQFFERTQDLTPPPPPTAEGKLDTSRIKEQEAEIKRIAAEFASEAAKISQSEFLSGSQISRATQQYERLGATWDNIRAKYLKLSDTAKAKVFELQKADEARIFAEQGTGAFNEGSRVPFRVIPGQPNTMLEDLQRTVIAQGAGPNGEDIPIQIYKQRLIAALNRNIAAASAEARDNEKAAKDNQKFLERIETAHQQALIQAQKQLNSLQAQVRTLPPARQQNIPLPKSAEAFIGTRPNGLPIYDPTIAAKLQQEIKQELANASNQNKAFQEFTAATKASAAIARGVNNQLESIEKLAQKKGIDLAEAYQQIFPGAAGPFRVIPQGLVREGNAAEGEPTFVSSQSSANQLRTGAAALRNKLTERLNVQAGATAQEVANELVQKYGSTFGSIEPQSSQAQARLTQAADKIRAEEEKSFEKLVNDFISGALKNVENASEKLTAGGVTLQEVPAGAAEKLSRARQAQQLNLEAEAAFNALRTQVARLPVSRQSNISLPSSSSGLLREVPETGQQEIDRNIISQIREQYRIELLNVQTQNRAFNDFASATRAAGRIAKSINTELESIEREARKAGKDLSGAFEKIFPGQVLGSRIQPQNLVGLGNVAQGEKIFVPSQLAEEQFRARAAALRTSIATAPPLPPKGPAQTAGGGGDDGVGPARQRLDLENKIGQSILQNASFLLKYVILYRIVHDTARAIENALTGFVRAGIEYNRVVEQQKLGLQGILADAFTIKDAQGQQITGLAAINQLQSVTAQQWSKIQGSALAVVGTTTDLMGLFEGILPFVSKLGGDLERAQELTRATAVATSLMGISFQDARSAMTALLQGRVLTRNRLIGSLGFSKEELDGLKGTPALLDEVMSRLEAFNAIAGDAQKSFAASKESLQDYISIISGSFTKPLTDAFSAFVQKLSDSNSSLQLFQRTADGSFQITNKLQGILNIAAEATAELLKPISQLGTELAGQASGDLPTWIIGIQKVLEAIVQAAGLFLKLSAALTTFIAENSTAINFFVKWPGALSLVTVATLRFLTTLGDTWNGIRRVTLALVELATKSVSSATAVDSVGAATNRLSFSAGRMGVALRTAFTGLVVAGVLYGLEQVIAKIQQIYDEAKNAKLRLDELGSGNVSGVVLNSVQDIKQGSEGAAISASQDVIQSFWNQFAKAQKLIGQTNGQPLQQSNVAAKFSENRDQTVEVSKQIETVMRDLVELTHEVKRPGTDKDALNEQIETKNAELENLRKRQQLLRDEAESLNKLEADQSTVASTANLIRQRMLQIRADLAKQPKSLPIDVETGRIDPAAKALQEANQRTYDQAGEVLASLDRFLNIKGNVTAAAQTAREALLPANITPNPQPPEEPKLKQGFTLGEAQNDLSMVRSESQQTISDIKPQMSAGATSVEEGRKAIIAVYEKQRDQEYAIWHEVEARAVKHYESLDAAGKKKADQSAKNAGFQGGFLEQQGSAVSKGLSEADKEFARNSTTQNIEIKQARDQSLKELEDLTNQINQLSAQTYGTVTDTALARFDKAVTDIKQKLADITKQSPELAGKAQAVQAALDQINRSDVSGRSSRDQIISSTPTLLNNIQSQQKLLEQQLANGTVTVETYIQRIRQLRTQELNLLTQEASALEDRRAQIEAGIAKEEAKRGTPGFDQGALIAGQAQLAEVEVQLNGIKQQMLDIESISARINVAFQAWGALTGQVRQFLAASEGFKGTNTFLEKMIDHLKTILDITDKITSSAKAFAELPKTFQAFSGAFQDVGGLGALGGLFTAPFHSGGNKSAGGGAFDAFGGFTPGTPLPTEQLKSNAGQQVSSATSSTLKAAGKFASAIPLIGIGISAAFAIGSAIFNHAVQKAKKDITEHFKVISKAFADGNITLGQALGDLQKTRQEMVQKYSSSKSGRKALKDLLPDVDSQIDQLKQQAKQAEKTWQDTLKQMFATLEENGKLVIKGALGTGVFGDFYRQLLQLQTTFNNYLDSIDRTTQAGVQKYNQALEDMTTYTEEFLREARQNFESEMLDFEGTALSAQEQFFSLLDQQQGLYTQLRSIDEQRQDLAEQMADAQEQRIEQQQKENDLAKRELDIRKQIADIIRQAAQDEIAIRQRGVLEAQLTVAQQKAIEISNVRNKAQEQIDDLRQQLADAQADAAKQRRDDSKQNQRQDRDFQRQLRNLDEQEAEARKQLRLNDIRLAGARAVADIEGQVFGLASDEFDLAGRQNQLAIQQAQVQVQKWQDTKALVDAIVETADGVFFDPPEGFPQIKVTLGNITIDNSDHSQNTINGGPGGGGGGGGGGGDLREPREPKDRGGKIYAASVDGYAYDVGDTARRQGFRDI
jgi:hypothetical protein